MNYQALFWRKKKYRRLSSAVFAQGELNLRIFCDKLVSADFLSLEYIPKELYNFCTVTSEIISLAI